jgi:hypothetical protein
LTALSGGHALGGQVHEDDLSLEALLAPVRHGHATLALVTLESPEYVKRAYAVPGNGAKRCAPYDFIEYRARLDRVVRSPKDGPKLAAALRIVPANVPDLVHLTHLECVSGTSKSPIWPRYAGLAPAPGATRLVVLRHQETYGWLESVSGSWLSPDDLPRIERWLAQPDDDAPVR